MAKEEEDSQNLNVTEVPPAVDHLHGLRLYTVGIGIGVPLFLVSLEVSIVSTSLVVISNELGGFDRSSWIITAYLLTYTGFLMIWSRAGDIFGGKPILLISLLLFIAFSGACGAAQSLNQLIICRAFQGIGAAGVYSLTLFSFVRLLPLEKFDLVSLIAGAIMSMGLVLGPLLGGAINSTGNWRWVFLLNVPAGGASWIVLFAAFPRGFLPGSDSSDTSGWKRLMMKQKTFMKSVDFLGAFVLLAASILLITALQEANSRYSWTSALILSFLVVSGFLWLVFLLWERFLSRRAQTVKPMLPWHLMKNRLFIGVVLGFTLTGAPLTLCVIELPQRFQTVNNSSALGAGVKLLAYALSNPIGATICSLSAGKLKIPFVFILLVGITLQAVGMFLLAGIPTTPELWMGQFGYIVLAGLGVGIAAAVYYMMMPLIVDAADQAIALGTGLQFRMMGGALGIAIAVVILNSYVKDHLASVVPDGQWENLQSSIGKIDTLPPDIQRAVRSIYAEAYNRQMKAAGGFALAQLLTIPLIWKSRQVRMKK